MTIHSQSITIFNNNNDNMQQSEYCECGEFVRWKKVNDSPVINKSAECCRTGEPDLL